MTAIESLFLAMYPLWPKSLLAKFANLLSFEVAKINPEINTQIVEKYAALYRNYRFRAETLVDQNVYVNSLSILNPANLSKTRKLYVDRLVQVRLNNSAEAYLFYNSFTNRSWEYRDVKAIILYDRRLFTDVSWSIAIDYIVTGRVQVGIFEYTDAISPIISIDVIPKLSQYNGASTVLAMIENGVPVDVDKALLAEFVTFINAYSKYSGELAASVGLQLEKNRQALTDYKNSISEKLASRKDELGDLKTQIAFAAKNETNSAKRDMHNLLLSAQSLMVQLQEKIK